MTLLEEFIELVAMATADLPAPVIVDEDQGLAYLRDILAADGLDLADPTVHRTALATAYIPMIWASADRDIVPAIYALAVVLARYAKAVGR